jgi:mono/diheme cytochrome c family protein
VGCKESIDVRVLGILVVAIAQASALLPDPVLAEELEGRKLVLERCASCHDVSGPAPQTYQELVARKAPDLFYAGNKFARAWLVEWIQSPTTLRRVGALYLNHIENENGKDRIAEETVRPCPAKLTPAEAEAVADYLMTLEDPAMKTEVIDVGKTFKKPRAVRLFTKQLPCIGCHRIKFGKRELGGVSGPDLRKAGARLNPDWIYARIENPQYWDPKTAMPRIAMSHRKREMLTLFISSMK